MTKTKKQKILRIISIALLILVVWAIALEILSVQVTNPIGVLRSDYRHYYLFDRPGFVLLSFPGVRTPSVLYFLPFQKLILTRKIEKDLSEEIMSLPEKYSNNIRNVQIREDFESVVIYYYKDTGPGEAYTDMEEKARFTIQLYHELKNVKSDGKIFNFTPVPR